MISRGPIEDSAIPTICADSTGEASAPSQIGRVPEHACQWAVEGALYRRLEDADLYFNGGSDDVDKAAGVLDAGEQRGTTPTSFRPSAEVAGRSPDLRGDAAA
jgi:hypothetical protein